MKPIGRPQGIGPVHRFIDHWLRVHAPDPVYRPRAELVAAVAEEVARSTPGFAWLRHAGDLDREVRALVAECSDLDLPVLSGPSGYTSGDPARARAWRIADLQDLKRIHAHRRRIRRRRWAREAEARRRAGQRMISPTSLFDLSTVTAAPRRAVYA